MSIFQNHFRLNIDKLREKSRVNTKLLKILLLFFIFIETILLISFSGATSNFGFIKHLEFNGPFTESGYPGVFIIDLPSKNKLFNYEGDSNDDPFRSNTQVLINKLNGKGHILHSEISNSAKLGYFNYSHWNNALYFSIPEHLKNIAEVTVEVKLIKQLNSLWRYLLYFLILLKITAIIYIDNLRKNIINYNNIKIIEINSIIISLFTFIIILIFLPLIFILLIELIGDKNQYIYKIVNSDLIIVLAEFHEKLPMWGVIIVSYVILLRLLIFRLFKIKLLNSNIFNIVNIFFILIVYLWADYFFLWNGFPRLSDLSSSSVAGIVPFNDAHGHFLQPYLVYFNGTWDVTGSRRPIAAALRLGITSVAGFNLFLGLLLQSALCASSLTFMHYKLRSFIGELPCWLITCLILIICRPYLQTFLTESIAVSLFIISGTLIVKSVITNSLRDSIWALFFCLIAELVRPSNIFMIPLIFIWAVWLGYKEGKFKILIPVLIAGAIFSGSSIIQTTFSSNIGGFGSNFGEILCGAVHDKDWTYCSNNYRENIQNHHLEKDKNTILLKISLDKFISNPELIIGRVANVTKELLIRIPQLIVGIDKTNIQENIKIQLLSIVKILSIIGLFFLLFARRRITVLIIIWLISIIFSSGVIYFDDGTRTMVGVWIYFAFLIGISASLLNIIQLPIPKNKYANDNDCNKLILSLFLILFGAGFSVKLGLLNPYLVSNTISYGDSNLPVITESETINFGFIVSNSYQESRMFKFQMTGEKFEQIIKNSWIRQYEKIPSYSGEPFIFYVNTNKNGGTTIQIKNCNLDAPYCESK